PFRRQHPIGRYIVDFVCLERHLIVEVDGPQHAEEAHVARDERRDRWLDAEGYRVMRFQTIDGTRTSAAWWIPFGPHCRGSRGVLPKDTPTRNAKESGGRRRLWRGHLRPPNSMAFQPPPSRGRSPLGSVAFSSSASRSAARVARPVQG